MGLRGDERGQSEVIGALLIFVVIVAFIGLNQAVLVPQANEEIEFKHHNDVQRDIVDLRAATTEAAASNQPRSRTIDLGTDYPSRFVAINPPPATGTIQTEGGGEIEATHPELSISDVCGTGSDPVDTKFIQYQPNYNEYGNALPMTVENTIVYRDAGTSKLYSTGQVFAKGNQINIIRYVGDVEESSAGSASLDLIPSETGIDVVDTSDETLELTIPTRLSQKEWDSLVDSGSVTTHDAGNGKVRFDFEDSTYTIRCTTVGINKEPDVTPRTSAESSNRNLINPNAGGEVVLVDTESVGSGAGETPVSIYLEDRTTGEETIEIVGARLNFYSATAPGASGSSGAFLELGGKEFQPAGEFKYFDSGDEIPLNGDPTEVELDFDDNVESDDFYVLTFEYSNGDTKLYFVSHDE